MSAVRAYAAFVLGAALMLGGAYECFTHVGAVSVALEWGVVAVLGAFPFVYSLPSLLATGDDGDAARGTAPGKTDSPFGPR